jgi:hypothetical protein
LGIFASHIRHRNDLLELSSVLYRKSRLDLPNRQPDNDKLNKPENQ